MSTDHVTDELFSALEDAAERGVEVRVLFDHLGTLRIKGYRKLIARLKASKIQWRPMLPLSPVHGQWRRPDLRNHRKIMVIDGEVAFTGSQNLIEPSYNNPRHRKVGREWVELMACLRGPDRHHPQRRLRHGLAQRDRRVARGPAGAPARTARPATSRPRWCPAAPASSPRTTCGSSTR